jgi:hypothetical protein
MTKTKTLLGLPADRVVALMGSENAIGKVRRIFYHGAANLEQADAQRKPPGPVERRRMEFETAQKIIEAVLEIVLDEVDRAGGSVSELALLKQNISSRLRRLV